MGHGTWDIGHAGNGTYRTLALIRISVFRDRISEPQYYDPYLQNTTTSLTYTISIPRLRDGATRY